MTLVCLNLRLLATRGLLAALVVVSLLSQPGCRIMANRRNASGVKAFAAGQYPVAQQKFQQALQANPRSADAKYNLGAVAHLTALQNRDRGQIAAAENYYNQCLDLDPNHVNCRRALAVLLTEDSRPDQAFTMLKNWVVTSPGVADARIELARLYEDYGDLRTAEQQLQQALALDVRNARAHSALGHIKELSGDYQQAAVSYERAVQLDRSEVGAAQRLASLRAGGGVLPGAAPNGAFPATTPPIVPNRNAGLPFPNSRF